MSEDAAGASNYLKMEGSVYIPMSPSDSPTKKLPTGNEPEDEAKGYADKLRKRTSSAGEAIPLKPMKKVDPVVRSESSPAAAASLPPREEHCTEAKTSDLPEETMALIHHDAESSPAAVAVGGEGPEGATAKEPHVPPPRKGIEMRPKKGCNSNESVASSGFHSDYITDVDSAPPNYDLVMSNGHAGEDVSTV